MDMRPHVARTRPIYFSQILMFNDVLVTVCTDRWRDLYCIVKCMEELVGRLLNSGSTSAANTRAFLLGFGGNTMQSEGGVAALPWRLEDIDLASIDPITAARNEDLIVLLCASSFVESGSDLYSNNLSIYFDGDEPVQTWLDKHWEPEELQHGRALRAYIARVWPDFDWDYAFAEFFSEYSKTCKVEDFEKTRGLELAAR